MMSMMTMMMMMPSSLVGGAWLVLGVGQELESGLERGMPLDSGREVRNVLEAWLAVDSETGLEPGMGGASVQSSNPHPLSPKVCRLLALFG